MLEQFTTVSGHESVFGRGDSRRDFLRRLALASSVLAMQNLLNLDTFAEDPPKKESIEVWPKVTNLPPIEYVGVHGPEEVPLGFGTRNAKFHYEINRKKLLFPDSVEIVSLRKFPLIQVFGEKFHPITNPLADVEFDNILKLPPAHWPKAWPHADRHQFNDIAFALGGVMGGNGITSKDWIMGQSSVLAMNTNPMDRFLDAKFELNFRFPVTLANFDRPNDRLEPGNLVTFLVERKDGERAHLLSGRLVVVNGKTMFMTKPFEGGDIVAMTLDQAAQGVSKNFHKDAIFFEIHKEKPTNTHITSIPSPKE